jgi:hypothetical protein
MPPDLTSTYIPAWYFDTRPDFLDTPSDRIANQLAGRAADESLEIEHTQAQEWNQSIEVLQESLDDRIAIIREALQEPACEAIRDVILEFDFRRRGLRMDCLLLGDGVLFVVEFKRSHFGRADRDQVMNYAVNLVEFHRLTQEWCDGKRTIVVPVLSQTDRALRKKPAWPGLGGHSWPSVAERPLECDAASLKEALMLGLENRRSTDRVSCANWLASPFRPSSSILDATLSLYGNHDVAAIQEHAAPKAAIDASTTEIREHIEKALAGGAYHIVFLSGAPGAGKTLVGLDLAMRGSYAESAVFVTGNAPLVDVLNEALRNSYRAQGNRKESWTPTGYRRADARIVSSAATFKIVKAHNFLGRRGRSHGQEDSRVLVFDEAQRTYEKGRVVLGEKLSDHEADLILEVQRKAFPDGGAVVVALIGHNQAINRGERGIVAWLAAAERHGWSFSIGDETLELAEFEEPQRWAAHPNRWRLTNGHLHQSMRYYRNAAVERWVGALLDNDVAEAKSVADEMEANGSTVWLTRDLSVARRWARERTHGAQRAGLIASGQARRLAAEGLFVDYKPNIAKWMLAPGSDIRSSNALETVQNQYQIQGLELDYCIVCWDADLRREGNQWRAYKISGTDWQKDNLLEIAKNGYRVILTRARKGMVIFVPRGDTSGEDPTRKPAFYDGVCDYLCSCGVKLISDD